MSSFLRNLFSKVVQRGAAAAEPPPAPPPKWSQAGLPPMTKFRPPTKDGRAPQSAGDIDPKLLAELYKMGPALKTETSQPTAPPTSEERSRKARCARRRRRPRAASSRPTSSTSCGEDSKVPARAAHRGPPGSIY